MKKFLSSSVGIPIVLMLGMFLCFAAVMSLPGCTPAQLATAQVDLADAKSYLAATTQATAQAQEAKTEIDAELATAKTEAAAIPLGTPAATQASDALAKLAQADALAQVGIATAANAENKADALLSAAQAAVTALQTPIATPDFSVLSVFGTYGTIAGFALTGLFAIVKALQNNNLLSQLTAHKVALAALTGSAVPLTVNATAISHPSLSAKSLTPGDSPGAKSV